MARLKCITSKLQRIDTRKALAPVAEQRLSGGEYNRQRSRIMLRDNYLCQMCLQVGRITEGKEVDHRVSLADGGSNSDANQWLLCVDCHRAKSEEEEAKRSGRVG